MGEQVTAFVQLAPGATVTDDELIAWCRERLSATSSAPARCASSTTLPRLPTGKLLKRLLLNPR